MKTLIYNHLQTPAGVMTLVSDESYLYAAYWGKLNKDQLINIFKTQDIFFSTCKIINEAKNQLTDYFKHKLQNFKLPLKFCYGTDFQKNAWKELEKIPYGQTLSYSSQATKIGHPKAFRAVGSANSKNPFSIIIPCHRVIGLNGKLTGYAGGLNTKGFLLKHEGFNSL